jgi:large subunit ribosomal protein L17
MRHLKGFRTLNRTHSHRKALYKNMVTALFLNERIKTTSIKAKELRRIAEKIITRAKVKDLHNIRIISKFIKDEKILMKLFDEIAPRYLERNGGYTRIIKLDKRMGDGAELSYIELVEETGGKKKKTKKSSDKKKNIVKDTENVKKIKEKEEKIVDEVKEVKEEIKEEKNDSSDTTTAKE